MKVHLLKFNSKNQDSLSMRNNLLLTNLDIDWLCTPDTTLFDIGAIRYKLKQLLGVSVDVLTPRALPEKFRQSVLDSALTI